MLQEFFFDGVPVEPGDSAQPPGDGRAGPAAGFQLSGEAFDVGAPDGEQVQGAGPAPGGELAQVQGAGLAGQAAVSGQEPGEGEPLWPVRIGGRCGQPLVRRVGCALPGRAVKLG